MNEDAPTPLKYCVARRTPKVKRHNRDEWPIRTDYDLACALAEFASPAAFAATHPTELGDALARALFTRDLALAELRWCDAERRLALRALAEYAHTCSWQGHCDRHLATHEWDPAHGSGDALYCDACSDPDLPCPPKPLRHAAQIAAADEEMGR